LSHWEVGTGWDERENSPLHPDSFFTGEKRQFFESNRAPYHIALSDLRKEMGMAQKMTAHNEDPQGDGGFFGAEGDDG
jgi:hypothetical protein